MSVFQQFVKTAIPGCLLIHPWRHQDNRGVFIKTFHAKAFSEQGLETDFQEDFYSVSRHGVLRGMHFQSPPHHSAKLVYCAKGRIFDAVVDLRTEHQTFGAHDTFELSDENGSVLYIPPGVAHGFYVQSEEAITVYRVSSEFSPECDAGVRWNTCGIPWPTHEPIVSPRDASLPPLEDLKNMFSCEFSREAR